MIQVLRLSEITKTFNGTNAVENLSLTLGAGQILSLLGPSGCGKTTTLRLVAGFIKPDMGVIEIYGKSVNGPGTYVPPEKRRVGVVFQDYALFPHLNVYQNIVFGVKDSNRNSIASKYISLLNLHGLEKRLPSELSGGQQQRVAIARALAPRPDLLLLDEPFSNLDTVLRYEVRKEIREILKSTGTTAIFVTHDQEEAFFMGDRVAVMNSGVLEQCGNSVEIYHNPYSEFVATFVGLADFLNIQRVNGEASTALGNINIPENVKTNDNLQIMLRPDDISLEKSQHSNGSVISSFFRGDSYLYRIRLDSGEIVHSAQHHTIRIPDGSRIFATISHHHNPSFFKNRFRVNG